MCHTWRFHKLQLQLFNVRSRPAAKTSKSSPLCVSLSNLEIPTDGYGATGEAQAACIRPRRPPHLSILRTNIQTFRAQGQTCPNAFVSRSVLLSQPRSRPWGPRQVFPTNELPDTKEKPFICRCGAAFARRDLLTRHQRITSHERPPGEHSPDADSEQSSPPEGGDANMAAAVSLSGMSMNPWAHESRQPQEAYPDRGHELEEPPQVLAQSLQQQVIPPEFFGHDQYARDGFSVHLVNMSSSQDIEGFDHFKDFTNFLDGVGLPAEWSPYFPPPQPEEELVDIQLREPTSGTITPGGRGGRPGTPFSCWLPSAGGSRIPEVNPINSKPHFLLH
jgi:hypothetical protein